MRQICARAQKHRPGDGDGGWKGSCEIVMVEVRMILGGNVDEVGQFFARKSFFFEKSWRNGQILRAFYNFELDFFFFGLVV